MKSLIAETAYNVIQALPENELQRLYKMIEKDRKIARAPLQKKKVDSVWPLEVYLEIVTKQFNDKKLKRIAN